MINGKKILILGFGKEGVAAANFLSQDNSISIYDEKKKGEINPKFTKKLTCKPKFYFGDLPQDVFFDYVVRSPSIRPDDPLIGEQEKRGAILTSSTKIFFENSPCPIIGVTGTKGKGTTSTLIYELLKTKYKDVYLGGNIGISPLEFLPKINKDSLVVLELSSFQLFDLDKSPHIAVVLMITSEHLNWHVDVAEYRRAKESIVAFQKPSDFAVVNRDYPQSLKLGDRSVGKVYYFSAKDKTNGVYLRGGKIVSEISGSEEVCKVSDVLLPGVHNLQNVMAAVTVAKIYGVENENIKKVLTTFKGLVHRLQLVRELSGVRFYNDSFSTTPETTIAAIEAFKDPKILILGGSSKNSDFFDLSQKVVEDKTIKALILIGEESIKIKRGIMKAGTFEGKVVEGLKTMKEIVEKSVSISNKGDVVVLSPACASFDMFKNYEDRGEQFIKEVNALKK